MRETGLKNLMLNKFLGVFRKFDNLDEVKFFFSKISRDENFLDFEISFDSEHEKSKSSRTMLVWMERRSRICSRTN